MSSLTRSERAGRSASLSVLDVVSGFCISCSHGHVVVFHGFNLHFLSGCCSSASFHVPVCHSCDLFGRVLPGFVIVVVVLVYVFS